MTRRKGQRHGRKSAGEGRRDVGARVVLRDAARGAIFKENYTHHEMRVVDDIVRDIGQSLTNESVQHNGTGAGVFHDVTCHCALCIKSQSLKQSLMYAHSKAAPSHCFFK